MSYATRAVAPPDIRACVACPDHPVWAAQQTGSGRHTLAGQGLIDRSWPAWQICAATQQFSAVPTSRLTDPASALPALRPLRHGARKSAAPPPPLRCGMGGEEGRALFSSPVLLRGVTKTHAPWRVARGTTAPPKDGVVEGAQSRKARKVFVKCDRPANYRRLRFRSLRISRAALWPGAPVTPPPGWVPAPHM